MAHLVTTDLWGVARPVKLPSGWLWPRGWLGRYRDHAGHLSGAEEGRPLFVGLVRAKFGWGMTAWKKGLGGRVLPPRWGGTRVYIMDGTSRAKPRIRADGSARHHGKCARRGQV